MAQHEIGGAALALMADGAAELLHRMRAVGIDEQIEPRMGGVLRTISSVSQVEAGGPSSADRRGRSRGSRRSSCTRSLDRSLAGAVCSLSCRDPCPGSAWATQGHIAVEAAAVDAQVAGGAAIVARHILEAAVVDGQIGQPKLVDLASAIEGVEDGRVRKVSPNFQLFCGGQPWQSDRRRPSLLEVVLGRRPHSAAGFSGCVMSSLICAIDLVELHPGPRSELLLEFVELLLERASTSFCAIFFAARAFCLAEMLHGDVIDSSVTESKSALMPR